MRYYSNELAQDCEGGNFSHNVRRTSVSAGFRQDVWRLRTQI